MPGAAATVEKVACHFFEKGARCVLRLTATGRCLEREKGFTGGAEVRRR